MTRLYASSRTQGTMARQGSGDLGLHVNIMQSYCSSFYGSQLWDLSNKCIDRLSISWRRTHSVYLPLICECLPLNVQLELRDVFYERFKQYKENDFVFYLIMFV